MTRSNTSSMPKHSRSVRRPLLLSLFASLALVHETFGFIGADPTHQTSQRYSLLRSVSDHGDDTGIRTSDKVHENPPISRGSFLSALASAAVIASTTTTHATCANAAEKIDSVQPMKDSRPAFSLLTSKEEQMKTFQESISGFVAGGSLTLTKTFVKYPLDTATVRLQMPGTDYSIRDPLRLFNQSYRGVLAPLLWNLPAGAIFFAVKDATKEALRPLDLPRWISTSIAVAAAQCPYWIVRNPSEVVKTRQQANVDGYGEGTSTLDAFKMVYEEGGGKNGTGIDAFYSGYWQNILYAYPADVVKFVCYDAITRGKKNLPPLEGAVAGAASTAIAQLVTTPLDVVRNRVMAGEEPENEKPASYIGSLVKLAQEEGVEGLFAGASPRAGKAILSGAIQFATYEETKQKLNAFFQSR